MSRGWCVICARNACDLCPSALVCIEVHLTSFIAKSFAFIHGCILQVMHLIAYQSIYGTFWNVHLQCMQRYFCISSASRKSAFMVHLESAFLLHSYAFRKMCILSLLHYNAFQPLSAFMRILRCVHSRTRAYRVHFCQFNNCALEGYVRILDTQHSDTF